MLLLRFNLCRALRQVDDGPGLFYRRQLLTPMLHTTVSEKAWSTTQLGCRIHHPDDVLAGPVITFPVGIEPWSAQSTPEAVALRSAVNAAMTAKRTQLLPFGDLPLCLTITALVARASAKKDIDNLVKGVLDAMQGYLYRDDHQIECLTVRRMVYSGATGHYVVHALATLPVTADVIWDASTPPRLVNGLVAWPQWLRADTHSAASARSSGAVVPVADPLATEQ